MKHTKNETNQIVTPTKALINMMERIETQTSRINLMEQQVLDLFARMGQMEDSKIKSKAYS